MRHRSIFISLLPGIAAQQQQAYPANKPMQRSSGKPGTRSRTPRTAAAAPGGGTFDNSNSREGGTIS